MTGRPCSSREAANAEASSTEAVRIVSRAPAEMVGLTTYSGQSGRASELQWVGTVGTPRCFR